MMADSNPRNIASRPDPYMVTVSCVGAGVSTITVPVLSEDTDAAHSTVVVPIPVNPSGEVGLAQALPIFEVGVFGSRLRRGAGALALGAAVLHVIHSPASVDSASPVTSSQPVAGSLFESSTWMLTTDTVVVPPPV